MGKGKTLSFPSLLFLSFPLPTILATLDTLLCCAFSLCLCLPPQCTERRQISRLEKCEQCGCVAASTAFWFWFSFGSSRRRSARRGQQSVPAQQPIMIIAAAAITLACVTSRQAYLDIFHKCAFWTFICILFFFLFLYYYFTAALLLAYGSSYSFSAVFPGNVPPLSFSFSVSIPISSLSWSAKLPVQWILFLILFLFFVFSVYSLSFPLFAFLPAEKREN